MKKHDECIAKYKFNVELNQLAIVNESHQVEQFKIIISFLCIFSHKKQQRKKNQVEGRNEIQKNEVKRKLKLFGKVQVLSDCSKKYFVNNLPIEECISTTINAVSCKIPCNFIFYKTVSIDYFTNTHYISIELQKFRKQQQHIQEFILMNFFLKFSYFHFCVFTL